MGRRVWKQKVGAWNTILYKQDFRKEKVFQNREANLKNSTSFFLSNLPDSCDRFSLWNAFEHFDNLEDTFVPSKRDKAGNKFGFIKLSNVQDPQWWMEKIKEVRFDGVVLSVNLARFYRDGSKVGSLPKSERVSVFSRLHGLKQTPPHAHGPISNYPSHFGSKSYSAAVTGLNSSGPGGTLDLPPMNTAAKKNLEFKSLVGEVVDIDTLNDLKHLLSGLTEDGILLKYLGGLKVLLCFNKAEDAEEFRWNMVNTWENWFSRLYIWEGIPPIFERVAWIKILGVPVCLWDRHVFNKIGERCGRLLVKSEAEKSNGNLAEDRLAILVHSGKSFSTEFDVSWKEHKFKVWVEEISG
ncbi:putative RNA recognition motif domain, nucleotide-binding alpha-beta plait domain superfamily [Helianthus annuus]|nr:putative RNA recognition motif domain, nucleotide-binding alpha-beta plait domain superfamily [Helianthus annuus]KAJ0480798.1 putative RNA recognition motif domain, nucleotide-binding alpha-beta plait domain superfamily [Helianthus annuus]KAJ0670894.1 putative RNA recognition motif domain, nucleotide-binding alpha-beta plait domain superfamily [Helianthus annuus]KAJ0857825.1 putative RNA recognition motif domain, nucleotide-binding alpha-beta plait domain superfamily [Helianthus annuus]